MDLNPQLNLRCPKCDVKISQAVQRRMNSFFGGLSVTDCEACKVKIQWHHSLHNRFRVGGILFRSGLLLVALSIISLIVKQTEFSSPLVSTGIILVLAGTLTTYTKNENIKVEIVGKT